MPLAKRIIPCLDVDNGRVVKGVKFVDIRDAGDPVEVARRYDSPKVQMKLPFLILLPVMKVEIQFCMWWSRLLVKYLFH